MCVQLCADEDYDFIICSKHRCIKIFLDDMYILGEYLYLSWYIVNVLSVYTYQIKFVVAYKSVYLLFCCTYESR